MRLTDKVLWASGGLFFLGLIVSEVGYTFWPTTPVVATTAFPVSAPAYTVDPRIVQVADQLGIDRGNLVKARAQFGDPAKSCREAWAGGCFTGVITLSESALSDPIQFRTILAHEYLHWVWATQDHTQIEPLVREFYLANQIPFDHRMQGYIDAGVVPGSEQYLNEVHSYAGTEISDWRLPPALLAWYTHWLPNRAILPSYY